MVRITSRGSIKTNSFSEGAAGEVVIRADNVALLEGGVQRCPEFSLHVGMEPRSKDLEEVDNGDSRGKMVSKGSYELG